MTNPEHNHYNPEDLAARQAMIAMAIKLVPAFGSEVATPVIEEEQAITTSSSIEVFDTVLVESSRAALPGREYARATSPIVGSILLSEDETNWLSDKEIEILLLRMGLSAHALGLDTDELMISESTVWGYKVRTSDLRLHRSLTRIVDAHPHFDDNSVVNLAYDDFSGQLPFFLLSKDYVGTKPLHVRPWRNRRRLGSFYTRAHRIHDWRDRSDRLLMNAENVQHDPRLKQIFKALGYNALINW